jgi:hypothetical protein
VNTPDERRDIPAEIRPKLEKLESQTRINMRIQGEPPRPRNGGEGDRPRRGPDADDRRPS